MATAKRVRRIDVWLDHATALAAASEDAKVLLKMTIWGHDSTAIAHQTYSPGGSSVDTEGGDHVLTEAGDLILLEAA